MIERRIIWQPRRLRLRTKLVLLMLAVTVTSTLVLSVTHYFASREREYALALTELSHAADQYSDAIGDALAEMKSDAELIAGFPPIPGIARTMRTSEGVDPDGQSELDLWRERLETIFSNFLIARPHFTQVRLIGKNGNWRELVRANRIDGAIEIVPTSELQSKGSEPYIRDIMGGNADSAYFSDVTPNREHGRIEGPPTIRVVRPVVDGSGKLFGAIVINADYEALLRNGTPEVSPEIRVTAIDNALDYMVFETGQAVPELTFHTDADWQKPQHAELLEAGTEPDQSVLTDRSAVVLRTIVPATKDRTFALYVLTEKSRLSLLGRLDSQLRGDVLLSSLLSLLAIAAGSYLVRPLLQLHQKIITGRTLSGPIEFQNLPADEVGELASEFMALNNELIRESAKVKAIFSGAGNAIVVIDDTGKIEEANPAAAELFGYDIEDLLKLHVNSLMPEADARMHDQYLSGFDGTSKAMAADREIVGRCKDGSDVPLEISVSRVRYAGGSHVIGILRDITDRKLAETQVKDLIDALERSNAELDQFAYVASHDLKAPLRVIDNASRWLAEDLEDHLTEDTRESLNLLRGRVGRMERLLDDLLEHARIERMDDAAALINGTTLMCEVRDLLALPDGFELKVSDEFSDILLPRMPVETVLLNLINNSVQHHDRGEGTIEVEVEDRGDVFFFLVRDDGPGILPEYHERVFELFQTLKPRDHVDTSGMGLAMVRKHVSLAGGQVSIESDGLRGTKVCVILPKRTSDHLATRRIA